MCKTETSNVSWHLEHYLYHLTECFYQLSSLWEIRLYKNKMLEIWHPKSEISIFCGFSYTLYCIADHIRETFGFCGPSSGKYVKNRDLKRSASFWILFASSSRVVWATFELMGNHFAQKLWFENRSTKIENFQNFSGFLSFPVIS